MDLPNPMLGRRCGRRTRAGGRCMLHPMRGQTICRMHGGKAPQNLAKAEERLRALVHPAINEIARIISSGENDSVKLAACRDVLDRCGYKPTVQIESNEDVTIRVIHEEAPVGYLITSTNGHTGALDAT
jgi:hypothetical protein